jgi:hydrogenase-4 component F
MIALYLLLVALPPLSALVQGLLRAPGRILVANALTSTLLLAVGTGFALTAHGVEGAGYVLADPFALVLLETSLVVGATTAVFAVPYLRGRLERGHLTARRVRLFGILYPIFLETVAVALTSNNLGILWIAMEAATLATVFLVSLERSPASIEAAWKYLILCGVGIALALVGTVLVDLAAAPAHLPTGERLLWSALLHARGRLAPGAITTAFAFLLVGYGTKAGLVPVHHWLPDAHAQGPAPVSAVLSGILLNVALDPVVRAQSLAEGALRSDLPGLLMIGFGTASVVVAALLLWRQHDLKRLWAYSSIEHMGLATLGFGLGTPTAVLGSTLEMCVHALTKSSLFFTTGVVSRTHRSQDVRSLHGLLRRTPLQATALLLGGWAILGLPPFGTFVSELLILLAAFDRAPLLALVLAAALLVAFAAISGRLQGLLWGGVSGKSRRAERAFPLVPAFVSLALVLVLGVAFPPPFAAWSRATVALLGLRP